MQENVLHKDHFTLIPSDLHMVEGEEAEVLTIFFREHLSLQEEGEEEEEEHDFSDHNRPFEVNKYVKNELLYVFANNFIM